MIQLIPKDTYRRARWKNGLGFTDQIAIFPESADLVRGDYLWRISSATIERSSDFSLFPHHDRLLAILEGDGMRLTHQIEPGVEDSTELPPLQAYEFPGDVPSRCELLGGAIVDLGVLIRRGEVEGSLEVERLPAEGPLEWQPRGKWNFLHAVRGAVEILPEGLTVPAGSTARLEAPRPGTLLELRSAEPGTAAALISLWRA